MNFLLILLAGLALIDSTSIGTLVIPIWFLLAAQKIEIKKFFLYLTTVAVFYFSVGMAGLFGAATFLQSLGGIFSTRGFLYVEITVGLLLVVLAFWLDPKRRKANARESRMQRWQRLIFTGGLTNTAIISLALTATALELATMAPYIGAIAILASLDVSWLERIVTLAGYVCVMVLPATVLLGVRLWIHKKVRPQLERFNAWIIKNTNDIFSWTVGIIGSAFACDGTVRLIIALT